MKILMSLIFYPRGGSAQVARYLSRALIEQGHEVHLITGTLRDGDPQQVAGHLRAPTSWIEDEAHQDLHDGLSGA